MCTSQFTDKEDIPMALKLRSIDAETLMYKEIDKPLFLVDELIPFGLTLFCGTQKIGKSWFMLDLCSRVVEGEPFLGLDTYKCDVLYMCLEDTMARIQRRLFRITDTASPRLHFTNEVHKIGADLIPHLESFIQEHPGIKLIVIDTLQKIRSASNDAAYAHDYSDLSCLKTFADTHHLALILVHHTRKQEAPDIFDKILGTSGIAGCADTSFVLNRENRGVEAAKLHVTGRDVEQQQLDLRFHDCRWTCTKRITKQQEELNNVPDGVKLAADMIIKSETGEWKGPASDLCQALGVENIDPPVLAKQLNQYHSTYLADMNITYHSGRNHGGRFIQLVHKRDELEACDGSDSSDGNIDIGTEAVTDTEPSPENLCSAEPYSAIPPPEDAPW